MHKLPKIRIKLDTEKESAEKAVKQRQLFGNSNEDLIFESRVR